MHTADFGEAIFLSAKIKERIEEEHRREKEQERRTAAKTLWIPVSERLPDTEGEYLVTVRYDDSIPISNRTKRCKFAVDFNKKFGMGDDEPAWYRDGFTGYPELAETTYEHVIAWMPYPEPYVEI